MLDTDLTGKHTRRVVRDFGVGLVGKRPDIVVVPMWIEGDLLLVRATGIHVCVRVKVAALHCQNECKERIVPWCSNGGS